jgi:penicillin-binding protein 2
LLLGATNVAEERFPISDSTVEKLTEAFFGVVNEGGTAANVKLPGIEFCGKTGTSQIISAKGKARAGNKEDFKNNAWFVGYAPRHNPEIVVAVLVQEGGHGNLAAAPIARDIVKAYYDKKARKQQNQLAADGKPPVTAGQPGVVLASPDALPVKREH